MGIVNGRRNFSSQAFSSSVNTEGFSCSVNFRVLLDYDLEFFYTILSIMPYYIFLLLMVLIPLILYVDRITPKNKVEGVAAEMRRRIGGEPGRLGDHIGL